VLPEGPSGEPDDKLIINVEKPFRATGGNTSEAHGAYFQKRSIPFVPSPPSVHSFRYSISPAGRRLAGSGAVDPDDLVIVFSPPVDPEYAYFLASPRPGQQPSRVAKSPGSCSGKRETSRVSHRARNHSSVPLSRSAERIPCQAPIAWAPSSTTFRPYRRQFPSGPCRPSGRKVTEGGPSAGPLPADRSSPPASRGRDCSFRIDVNEYGHAPAWRSIRRSQKSERGGDHLVPSPPRGHEREGRRRFPMPPHGVGTWQKAAISFQRLHLDPG
jgi:hypothetical protein